MTELAKSYKLNIFSEENIKNIILPYYNLENSEVIGIKFKDTDKQRAVYKIINNDKEYCLKKIYFGKDELLFVYSAIEWLYRNGINVPRILPNKDNGRFVNYEDMLFILTPWVEGVKCDYDSKEHIINSCVNLGTFHKITRDFFPIDGSLCRMGCNNLSDSINKHFEMLLLNSNLAFKYRDYFSKIFLSNFDKGIYLAKKSSELLSTIDFSNLNTSLCHMDYVNKNLIFDKNNNIWIIDFDKCRLDYRVHDLSYFSRRLLRREATNWNVNTFLTCLEAYESIHPLNIDEYKYLLGYLTFPQKYWKLSRDYYKNIRKCNKKAFISMLNKSVRNFNYQIEFAEALIPYIDKKFNINH